MRLFGQARRRFRPAAVDGCCQLALRKKIELVKVGAVQGQGQKLFEILPPIFARLSRQAIDRVEDNGGMPRPGFAQFGQTGYAGDQLRMALDMAQGTPDAGIERLDPQGEAVSACFHTSL